MFTRDLNHEQMYNLEIFVYLKKLHLYFLTKYIFINLIILYHRTFIMCVQLK